MRFSHLLPFGAELLSDGGTRFRLWAPDATHVQLAIEGSERRIDLERQTGGWFEATTPVGADTRYRYRIDDEIDVQDPAARFAPDGLKGFSEVIDPKAFEWDDREWRGLPWHRAVVYELHVGTFTREGTYAAIVPRLAELAELGINTLELLPIATFPGTRGWGYDGVLPFAPHPSYGRPEDLKRFIQAAHAAGIAVVLDVVYNHFGPEGNYLHRYASSFFTDRYQTPWGSAIDFETAAGRNVRDFFIQNALYWLTEYRFDGLRLDAVHAITDASRTHFVDELADAIEAGPARERHVHLILENHDNQALRLQSRGAARLSKAQWNDDFHHILHVLLTDEIDGYYSHYADRPHEWLARSLAEGFAYQGDPYGEAKVPRGEPSGQLAVTAFIDFLQNHDQIGNRAFGDRLVTLTDEARLKAGFALLLLSPHIPMLFMGEEYAARQPFLYFCDYEGELAQAITNGRRSEFAGFKVFADEHAREGIPDPNALETFEGSRLQWEQRNESPHREWLDYVRSLLRIRAERIVPLIPTIRPGTARATVRGNFITVRWPVHGGALVMQANLGDNGAAAAEEPGESVFSTHGSGVELQAWEVRVSFKLEGSREPIA
jgi:maltooligosyltrehalose trehalohydrolase